MTVWVIKIGTSLLKGKNKLSSAEIINHYCSHISRCMDHGHKVLIVSSGAVGLGCNQLRKKERPEDITELQAAAAVGQGHLMALYENGMKKHGYKVAQVLLTRAELGTRISYQNASLTIKKLLEWKVLPIINENDAISNEELKYGDNDTLSALVATAVSADNLILLTDIDHLYSSDPRKDQEAKPIKNVLHPNELKKLEKSSPNRGYWGTGGILTKLSAARIATESGIKVQLSDGRDPEILGNVLQGLPVGTLFHPVPNPLGNKKSWLAHAIRPVGEINLDEGACLAIERRGASVLLVGITKIEGTFSKNQPIRVLNKSGKEIARGISSVSSEILKSYIENPVTFDKSPIVVHRDALVLTSELVR